MIHNYAEAFPYITGITVASLGVIGSEISIWLSAGMTGVVVLLLLKFFPMLLNHMEDKDKRHEETIKHICEIHDSRNRVWQEIVQTRGICPIPEKDNHNQK
jgi:hypothetical protein